MGEVWETYITRDMNMEKEDKLVHLLYSINHVEYDLHLGF